MSKIRVVFSIGGMHGGGSERQMVSLLRNLDRTEIEPLLYLVYRSGPLLQEIPDDVPITAFEERYQGSHWPGILMHRRRVADMKRYLLEVRADVCYDRTFLMTLISADAAQQVGVPNVSTIVTDPSLGFAPVAGRFQATKKRILRRLYTRSTFALANSDGAARSAERFYGLEPNLVSTHYNGVDLQQVRSKAATEINDAWWNKPSESGRRFRIVSAGRLNEQKGFHLLVEAIRRLRETHPQIDLRLALLGAGPSQGDLERQIQQAQLTESIRLVGFRPDAPAWYKSADLFVLPSFLEGMPNVLLEAMACETAVLSTKCPSGPEEILAGGKFGALCETGQVDSLVEGIQKFLTDADHHQRYISVAKQHVEKNFSIEESTSRLEEILIQAAGRNKGNVG